MWCIVVFHSHGGYQVVGPFDSEETAKKFGRKFLPGGDMVAMMSPQEIEEYMEKNK